MPKKGAKGKPKISNTDRVPVTYTRNSIDDAIDAVVLQSVSQPLPSSFKSGPEPDTSDGGNRNGTQKKTKGTRAKKGSKVKAEPAESKIKAKAKRERKSSPVATSGSKKNKRSCGASPRQKSRVVAKVPMPKAVAAGSSGLSQARLAKDEQEPMEVNPEPPGAESIDVADLNTADIPLPGPSTTPSTTPKRKSPPISPTRGLPSTPSKKYVPKPPRKLPVDPVPIKSPVIYATKTNIEYMKQIKQDKKKVKGKKSLRNMQQQSLKVVDGGTKVKFFRGGVEEDNYKRLNKINIREKVPQPQEFDESLPWICCFCGYGTLELRLGDLFGPYYIGIPDSEQKKETWVHQDCALWAGGVLLVGTQLRGLDDAVYHAEKLACTICNNKGPTINCLQRGCNKIVHYICGKLDGWSLDYSTFHSYCDEHKGVCPLYSGL